MPLRVSPSHPVEHAVAQCHGVQKDRRNVCGYDADQAVGQDDMGLAQHSVQIRVERRDEFERGLDHKRVMPGLAVARSGGPVGRRLKALNRKRLRTYGSPHPPARTHRRNRDVLLVGRSTSTERCETRYLEAAHHMYCGVGQRLIVEMPRVVPAPKPQLQVVHADRKQRQ